MKLRGDTFKRAYRHWRQDRLEEIVLLRQEVQQLRDLVEWLCHKVIPDDD
tara:strand:- start:50 stop:199 length:150 start_codon:yes stop_codon:yes gene_type:complete